MGQSDLINQKREENQLSEDELATVKMVCNEVGPVSSAPDRTGFMDINEYIKVYSALIRIQMILLKKKEDASKSERRSYLEEAHNQAPEKFAQCCLKIL